jgi:2-polyprenyl-3-methyl-5-hydroxy-6-metoxy-1,4-benzoquinol methylase
MSAGWFQRKSSNSFSARKSRAIDAKDVRWAYQTILGREPESDTVIESWCQSRKDLKDLVETFLTSTEYRQYLQLRPDVEDARDKASTPPLPPLTREELRATRELGCAVADQASSAAGSSSGRDPPDKRGTSLGESAAMDAQSLVQLSSPPRNSIDLSTAKRNWNYTDAFEEKIAEYISGNRRDRSEKVIVELYTKVYWAQSFFASAEKYVNLSGKRFIEVGCGTGTVSVAAASRGGIVSSTDYVDQCVGFTKLRMAEHGLTTTAFRSDLRSPISDGRRHAFDFVWCFQVLEHIPRAEQFTALGNLFSLVAPGGFLFIDTENSLCPYDRHDTKTWMLRLASKDFYLPIITALGTGVNFLEPSTGERVQVRDYLSYDEIIGAAFVSGFKMINPFMPHLTKKKYLNSKTGSDWLHDSILKNFDVERFAPVSVLLQRH